MKDSLPILIRALRGHVPGIRRTRCDLAAVPSSPIKPPRRKAKFIELKPECIAVLMDTLVRKQGQKNGLIILDNIGSSPLVTDVLRKTNTNIACLFGDPNQKMKVDMQQSERVKTYDYSWITSSNKNKEAKILKQCLPGVQSESHVTLVSVLQTNQGGRENLLVKRFITSHGFFAADNLNLLCFMSAKFYTKLVRCSYPPPFKTVNAFYDHSLCLKLSTGDFIPRLPEAKIGKFSLLPDVNASDICLVHLQPRKSVLSELSQKDRLMFSLFMKLLPKDRLIPKMESLVPGCGLKLIEMGFTMAEETSDVHPHRYLPLYKALITWPEFEGSVLSVLLNDKQGQFKNTSTLFEL